jgi:hypothetical protein
MLTKVISPMAFQVLPVPRCCSQGCAYKKAIARQTEPIIDYNEPLGQMLLNETELC